VIDLVEALEPVLPERFDILERFFTIGIFTALRRPVRTIEG
jgi:hypothetical protein